MSRYIALFACLVISATGAAQAPHVKQRRAEAKQAASEGTLSVDMNAQGEIAEHQTASVQRPKDIVGKRAPGKSTEKLTVTSFAGDQARGTKAIPNACAVSCASDNARRKLLVAIQKYNNKCRRKAARGKKPLHYLKSCLIVRTKRKLPARFPKNQILLMGNQQEVMDVCDSTGLVRYNTKTVEEWCLDSGPAPLSNMDADEFTEADPVSEMDALMKEYQRYQEETALEAESDQEFSADMM